MEREHARRTCLQRWESSGWLLNAPVEAIWRGERDEESICEVIDDTVRCVIRGLLILTAHMDERRDLQSVHAAIVALGKECNDIVDGVRCLELLCRILQRISDDPYNPRPRRLKCTSKNPELQMLLGMPAGEHCLSAVGFTKDDRDAQGCAILVMPRPLSTLREIVKMCQEAAQERVIAMPQPIVGCGTRDEITVYEPNAEQDYMAGDIVSVRWLVGTQVHNVHIQLLEGDYERALHPSGAPWHLKLVRNLKRHFPNTGTFDWTIPAGFPPSRYYKIRVSDAQNEDNTDMSQEFALKAGVRDKLEASGGDGAAAADEPDCVSIVITAPLIVKVQAGTQMRVAWEAFGPVSDVNIKLYQECSDIALIYKASIAERVSCVQGANEYLWDIPIAESTKKKVAVVVELARDRGVRDRSKFFDLIGIQSTSTVVLHAADVRIGMYVVRGPDWTFHNQDGGPGSIGTITGWVSIEDIPAADRENFGTTSELVEAKLRQLGHVWVRWHNGHRNQYLCGGLSGRHFHLSRAPDTAIEDASTSLWHCAVCAFENIGSENPCCVCGADRSPDSRYEPGGRDSSQDKLVDWKCLQCTFLNSSRCSRCKMCNALRGPAAVAVADTADALAATLGITTAAAPTRSPTEEPRKCAQELVEANAPTSTPLVDLANSASANMAEEPPKLAPAAEASGRTLVEIPFGQLEVNWPRDQCGSGREKTAFRAIWHKPGVSREVAVLRFKPGASYEAEAAIYEAIGAHPGIVRCYGYSLDPETGQQLLVEELAELGSLHELVDELESDDVSLTPEVQLAVLAQVAQAMEAVAFVPLVHRDLSLRNILTCSFSKDDPRLCRVKVGDFGMARHTIHLKDEIYYAQTGPIAWAWAAPEVLKSKKFTEKSDVWAFGVLAWELFTMGRYPYQHVVADVFAMEAYLKSGERLPRPAACPKAVYELLLECWAKMPKARPTFITVTARLKDIEKELLLQRFREGQAMRWTEDEFEWSIQGVSPATLAEEIQWQPGSFICHGPAGFSAPLDGNLDASGKVLAYIRRRVQNEGVGGGATRHRATRVQMVRNPALVSAFRCSLRSYENRRASDALFNPELSNPTPIKTATLEVSL